MPSRESILGRNIRYLRKADNLSQRELAEKIGVRRNHISSYENGAAEPQVMILIKMSMYFGVKAEDMLSQDISMTSKNYKTKPLEQVDITQLLSQRTPQDADHDKERELLILLKKLSNL